MARNNLSRERQAAHFPAFENSHPTESASNLAPFTALVKRLSEAYGPSGSEEQIRDIVRDEVKSLVDQVRVDALGNLIAHRRGSGANRKKIMFSAHLDELGIIVTYIDSRGFCRFGALGAVQPLSLVGARVRFENGTIGVIGREDKQASKNEVSIESLYVDVGASSADTASVRIGDAAGFVREFFEKDDFLCGKALDDRIGCAVLIETLRQLKKSSHDLYVVFSAQHQVGARGAGTAAYAVQPDLAIVLDTSLASDTPGATPSGIALGKGPAIKFQDEGALTSSGARQLLLNAAREAHIPYQLDVRPSAESDNLFIQASREGVPTGVIGIPLRYHHTPSEIVHHADAENAFKLLLALLARPISTS
jgi:endoglucanase